MLDLATLQGSLDSAPEIPGKAERWALRVMQLGVITVVLISTVYKSFELDRFFLPKELTLHLTALIAGILAWRALRKLDYSAVDAILVAYLLLGLVSAILATNVWIGTRALAISISGVLIFWIARTLREAHLERPLVNALALAVVLGALTSCLQAYGFRTDLFSLNRAPGGTLGNRNFIAHLAAFGAPVVLLAALTARHVIGYLAGALGLSIVGVALVLTRSRAGWLAAAAVIVVWVTALVVSPPIRRSNTVRLRFAGIVIALAAGVSAAIVLPNSLRWRSENPYLDSMRSVA